MIFSLITLLPLFGTKNLRIFGLQLDPLPLLIWDILVTKLGSRKQDESGFKRSVFKAKLTQKFCISGFDPPPSSQKCPKLEA